MAEEELVSLGLIAPISSAELATSFSHSLQLYNMTVERSTVQRARTHTAGTNIERVS